VNIQAASVNTRAPRPSPEVRYRKHKIPKAIPKVRLRKQQFAAEF